MTTDADAKSVLAQTALNFVPPLIRETLLKDSDFREKYGLATDSVLSFGDSGVSIDRRQLFDAVRNVLAGASSQEVIDKNGRKWLLNNETAQRELPRLSISYCDQRFSLYEYFVALSPDAGTRLRLLDTAALDVNLHRNASDRWRNILVRRALEDEEVEAFQNEFFDTPVAMTRALHSEIMHGQSSVSSLVPPSRRYFERLVGEYDGSASIRDYVSGNGSTLFDQLAAWRPYDGFLFSLLLSSHSSMTAEINVDQLSSEDLVRAFDFLDKHGDRISQLGAIEVGFRVLPSRPEIEQTLIRLIEQIRDDDIEGQASGFKLLSALFCLVDGELSRIRLFSVEPPFYRRLAALSHAALIHRQLADLGVNIDRFEEWAFSSRVEQYCMQSLADMRLEPHWDPRLAVASQMKAEFFGRIMISANEHEQKITDSPIYNLVFGDDARSLLSLGGFYAPWLPGPLEGTEGTHRSLPPEVAEAIETQLSANEVGPSSFIALVDCALTYRISADQAELAAKALMRASHRLQNIENRSQLFTILDGLATVAAVTRSPTLADELRILVRRYRHDAEYALYVQEVITICLVAAASHSDLSEWTEFVGDWLTEFAFGDLKNEEGQVFYSSLHWLCHAVPELWVSCGKADAALMAFNAR